MLNPSKCIEFSFITQNLLCLGNYSRYTERNVSLLLGGMPNRSGWSVMLLRSSISLVISLCLLYQAVKKEY